MAQPDYTKWQRRPPKKAGYYWFYGYLYSGCPDKGLYIVEVQDDKILPLLYKGPREEMDLDRLGEGFWMKVAPPGEYPVDSEFEDG